MFSLSTETPLWSQWRKLSASLARDHVNRNLLALTTRSLNHFIQTRFLSGQCIYNISHIHIHSNTNIKYFGVTQNISTTKKEYILTKKIFENKENSVKQMKMTWIWLTCYIDSASIRLRTKKSSRFI